jgi:hypothetical protein
MSIKAKAPVRNPQTRTTAVAAKNGKVARAVPAEEPAVGTMAWRLASVAALGKRVEEHVASICKLGDLKSSSAEAKDRAVVDFHDRLVAMEGHLARIVEEVQLG